MRFCFDDEIKKLGDKIALNFLLHLAHKERLKRIIDSLLCVRASKLLFGRINTLESSINSSTTSACIFEKIQLVAIMQLSLPLIVKW